MFNLCHHYILFILKISLYESKRFYKHYGEFSIKMIYPDLIC